MVVWGKELIEGKREGRFVLLGLVFVRILMSSGVAEDDLKVKRSEKCSVCGWDCHVLIGRKEDLEGVSRNRRR